MNQETFKIFLRHNLVEIASYREEGLGKWFKGTGRYTFREDWD